MVRFWVFGGIAQGCPGSGSLFAFAAGPFLLDMKISIGDRSVGTARACACDVRAALRSIAALNIMARTFKVASIVEALTLECSKCVVVPLAAEFTPELASAYAAWASTPVAQWRDLLVRDSFNTWVCCLARA
ncbi:unnamed protein product [Prorocentrum cordatum]|uniref:Uncharacterized protein n=1 Tax=Prorocentrum cordatum TaxID=2364126 RepID=A0ABN9UTN6_9DINO|nr:unnamed protein product [Polarella glacialis]